MYLQPGSPEISNGRVYGILNYLGKVNFLNNTINANTYGLITPIKLNALLSPIERSEPSTMLSPLRSGER